MSCVDYDDLKPLEILLTFFNTFVEGTRNVAFLNYPFLKFPVNDNGLHLLRNWDPKSVKSSRFFILQALCLPFRKYINIYTIPN